MHTLDTKLQHVAEKIKMLATVKHKTLMPSAGGLKINLKLKFRFCLFTKPNET